jgi:hypothetical protein
MRRLLPTGCVVVAAAMLASCARAVTPGSGDGATPGADGARADAGCPNGLVLCGGRCVDLGSSQDNCGGCGNQCNVENQICVHAVCVLAELCNHDGTGECSGGRACCAERICCPTGTACVIAIPDFMGCCPVGEACH